MRVVLGLATSLALSSSAVWAADVGVYRPGTPYHTMTASDANVCSKHCAGDAQCRGWNFVKLKTSGDSGICEFQSQISSPVPSELSVSGINGSPASLINASSKTATVVQGRTRTQRVGETSMPGTSDGDAGIVPARHFSFRRHTHTPSQGMAPQPMPPQQMPRNGNPSSGHPPNYPDAPMSGYLGDTPNVGRPYGGPRQSGYGTSQRGIAPNAGLRPMLDSGVPDQRRPAPSPRPQGGPNEWNSPDRRAPGATPPYPGQPPRVFQPRANPQSESPTYDPRRAPPQPYANPEMPRSNGLQGPSYQAPPRQYGQGQPAQQPYAPAPQSYGGRPPVGQTIPAPSQLPRAQPPQSGYPAQPGYQPQPSYAPQPAPNSQVQPWWESQASQAGTGGGHTYDAGPRQPSGQMNARGRGQGLYGSLYDDVRVPTANQPIPSDPNVPVPTNEKRPVEPVYSAPLPPMRN